MSPEPRNFQRLLAHRHWPLIVAGLAVLLTLPSLGTGLLLDDHFVRLVVRQPESYPVKLPHPLDTFSFFKGDPEQMSESIDFGAFPWWINPEVKGCFWRPLTSMTQFVDHRLWPDHIWLMHLQSVLWYGALVLAAAFVFRRLMGTTLAAGLAALLFAVEEAHSIPVGFLANRNSVLACLFGLLALSLHHSWRREGNHAKGIAAAIMFAAALLSAEAGIGAMAYIAAYALVVECGPLKKRLLSLVPYAAVIIIWRCIWSGLGYGVSGIPLYCDPPSEPWVFIRMLFVRLPQLVTGQFALPPAELQALAMMVQAWTWFLSAAIAVLIFLLFWPMIKADRTARFFGLGALIALVPACATFAWNRNLMFVGIGAFGLLALWLTNRPRNSAWPRTVKAVSLFLIILHLIIAPLFLAALSLNPLGPVGTLQRMLALPNMEGIEGHDLIIVNHPSPAIMMHSLGERAVNGEPLPAHTRVLTQAFTPITLKRTSLTQLHLYAKGGIPGHFSRLLFTVSEQLKAGKEVTMEGLSVQVVNTDPTGLPIEAVFTFGRSIDDDSLVWLQWSNGSFHPFTPPAVGESIDIPARKLPFGFTYE